MEKRALAASLLLGAVAFVGLLHTVLAYAFETGLEQVGLLVAATCVVGILLVNVRP
jgi:ABC-type enterochelin transport system permease subunit